MPKIKIYPFLFRFCVCIAAVLSFSFTPAPATPFLTRTVIDKIEARSGGWIMLKSGVTMQFLSGRDKRAECRGELLYNRLAERMLLKCFNSEEKLLFAYKTVDDDFELYIPGHQAVYKGNIFDLENAETFESHLRPLDLYRGLKIAVVPAEKARVVESVPEGVFLEVYGERHQETYLARRLFVTENGSVPEETYFNFSGEPVLIIRRSRAKKAAKNESFTENLELPHQINLISAPTAPAGAKQTVLLFDKIQILSSPDSGGWTDVTDPSAEVREIPKLED